jgi:hypothetical protein
VTNLSKAVEWFRRAAHYGSINAENVLGIFCEQGGETSNHLEAVLHYTRAAVAGHPHGCYNLGRCLHEGFGVTRNDIIALEWFNKAAEQNHQLAQLSAAVIYEKGLGVDRNLRKSVEYYHLAMENGSERARLRLIPIMANIMLSTSKVILNAKRNEGIGKLPIEILIQILERIRPIGIISNHQLMIIIHNSKGDRNQRPIADFVRSEISRNIVQACDCENEEYKYANSICTIESSCTSIMHLLVALDNCNLISSIDSSA